MAVAMVPHAAPGKLLRHAVGTPRGRLKGTARPWRGACVCSASAPGKRPTAAVIGSSIAGMLTAAALADTCDVVVVERDSMPVNELGEASTYLDAARQRHGVPQFSQAHLMAAGGVHAFNNLLPGFSDALLQSGALLLKARNVMMVHEGRTYAFPPPPAGGAGVASLMASRALLERTVRALLQRRPGVRMLPGRSVSGLAWSPDGTRVAGVTIKERDDVAADLVVDASGRNSRLPRWLAATGRPAAAEVEVDADISYASRFYEMPPSAIESHMHLMYYRARAPHERRGALLQRIENNWAMVNLIGVGERLDASEAGFDAFLSGLPDTSIWQALRGARPLTPPLPYRGGANLRRKYEAADLPDGLLVAGDSLCSFNPAYGQGMTVAALEAQALHGILQARARRAGGALTAAALRGVSAEFQAAAGPIADYSFNLNASQDFRFPHTTGQRARPSPLRRAQEGYLADVEAVAAGDARVWESTYAALYAMASPVGTLFAPGIALKVLGLRARRALAALRGAPAAGGAQERLQQTQ